MGRRRKAFQHKLFDEPVPESSVRVSNYVGTFFEHLTAKVLKGERLNVVDGPGDNPDVEMPGGDQVESKASGCNRWLMPDHQLEKMAALTFSHYALWQYFVPRKHPGSNALHTKFNTVSDMYSHLGNNITVAIIMPTNMLMAMIDAGVVRLYEGAKAWNQRSGVHKGFYWFRKRTGEALQNGWRKVMTEHDIPIRWRKRSRQFDGKCIGFDVGVRVHRFYNLVEPEVPF